MKNKEFAKLIFPRPPVPLPERVAGFLARYGGEGRPTLYKVRLRFAPNHPAGRDGCGVLLTASKTPLDGPAFRWMREHLGAWIETNRPDLIRRCLELEPDDESIKFKPPPEASR